MLDTRSYADVGMHRTLIPLKLKYLSKILTLNLSFEPYLKHPVLALILP